MGRTGGNQGQRGTEERGQGWTWKGVRSSVATDLALGHGARDGKRVTVDASDESVAVLALALTAVVALEDDRLATSEAAVGDDDDLTLLQARRDQKGSEGAWPSREERTI